MKKCALTLTLLAVFSFGCEALDDARNAKIVGPGGAGPLDIETDVDQEHPADRAACKDYDDIEMMWHPNTAMDAELYVFLEPTGELWDLVFSGRVWAPIYVAAEHPVLVYMDAPDAIQRVVQTEIRAPSHPLKPEGWVDSDVNEAVPVPRCPELYRLELPADGDLFLLELEMDRASIWTKVVPK